MVDIKKQRKMLMKQLAAKAKEKGITQVLIAERTGLQQGAVSGSLAGKWSITLDNLLKLSNAVGVTIYLDLPK